MSLITNARHFTHGGDDASHRGIGPLLDGNDNLYVVAETSAQADHLAVFKSTDDGATWTEQDTGGRPDLSTRGLAISACVQIGTVLHIATRSNGYTSGMDVAWDIEYHTFNTSDASSNQDTWQIVREAVVSPTGDGAISTTSGMDIAVRSDGDVIIVHQGSDASVMGNGFERVAYSRREGTSWTSDIALNTTSLEELQLQASCVFGVGDNLHIGWKIVALGLSDFRARTLDAGNNLSSIIVPHITPLLTGKHRPVSYDRSGTQYVLIAPGEINTGDLQTRELEEDGSNDLSIVNAIQTVTAAYGASPNIGLVQDLETGDVWIAYRAQTGGALLTNQKAGAGGWSSATTRKSVDTRSTWWEAYTRGGGNHLGYVYCDHDADANHLFFDEITTGTSVQDIAVTTLAETDALNPVATGAGQAVGTLAEVDSLVPATLIQDFHIGDFEGAFSSFQGHQNPVNQIGSDLFMIEKLNSFDIGVYKSTDIGRTWTQVATVTGIPPGPTVLHTVATIVDSGDIHVITSAAGGEVQYHIFDPGTDTFTLSKEIVAPTTVGTTNRVVGIVVRSDGSVVCLYRTTSLPFVIKYAIRNGSWTNDLAISADDGVDSLHTAAIVLGASDRVHFFWHNHTDGTIYHRTLNSADVLQTEQLVTSPGVSVVDIDNYGAGRYAKSGGVRIGYFYETSIRKLGVIHADSADVPTWTQDSDITDEQIPDDAGQKDLLAGLTGDDTNEQFILAFQRSDLSVFFSLRPDGGSWSADTDTGLDALNNAGGDNSSGDFGLRVSGGVVFLTWWSINPSTPPDDWFYQEKGLGQEVTIGTLAETDSLIPVGVTIYKTIGTLAETDSLVTVNLTQGGGQDIIVGTMAEVETLLAIPGAKTVAIGTLAELEGLQSIAGVHVFNIGTLLETDLLIFVGLDLDGSTDMFIAIDLTDAISLTQAQILVGLGVPKSGDHTSRIYHPGRYIVRR